MEIRAYCASDLDESCTPIYSNKSKLPQSPKKPSAQVERGRNSPRNNISYFQKQQTLLLNIYSTPYKMQSWLFSLALHAPFPIQRNFITYL